MHNRYSISRSINGTYIHRITQTPNIGVIQCIASHLVFDICATISRHYKKTQTISLNSIKTHKNFPLTLILLKIVPLSRYNTLGSFSRIFPGDIFAQYRNKTMNVTNGINGRIASIGVRIFPVFSLYDLWKNSRLNILSLKLPGPPQKYLHIHIIRNHREARQCANM